MATKGVWKLHQNCGKAIIQWALKVERRLEHQASVIPLLPVEIWMMILGYAVSTDSLMLHYTTNEGMRWSPVLFLGMQANGHVVTADTSFAFMSQRHALPILRLRAVCSTWTTLLDDSPDLWYQVFYLNTRGEAGDFEAVQALKFQLQKSQGGPIGLTIAQMEPSTAPLPSQLIDTLVAVALQVRALKVILWPGQIRRLRFANITHLDLWHPKITGRSADFGPEIRAFFEHASLLISIHFRNFYPDLKVLGINYSRLKRITLSHAFLDSPTAEGVEHMAQSAASRIPKLKLTPKTLVDLMGLCRESLEVLVVSLATQRLNKPWIDKNVTVICSRLTHLELHGWTVRFEHSSPACIFPPILRCLRLPGLKIFKLLVDVTPLWAGEGPDWRYCMMDFGLTIGAVGEMLASSGGTLAELVLRGVQVGPRGWPTVMAIQPAPSWIHFDRCFFSHSWVTGNPPPYKQKNIRITWLEDGGNGMKCLSLMLSLSLPHLGTVIVDFETRKDAAEGHKFLLGAMQTVEGFSQYEYNFTNNRIRLVKCNT